MIWKTRDGRLMDIKEMTDSHLDNTINYVARRLKENYQYERLAWATLQFLRGEMAIYYAEQDCDRICEQNEELAQTLFALKAEKRRRDNAQ